MNNIINISNIEQLKEFLNDNNLLEIAIRDKSKKFQKFQKVMINNLEESQAKNKVDKAISILNKNQKLGEITLTQLGNISKISKLNLVINGLNLCASCVGFAIMYAKLDKMSGTINQVLTAVKLTQGTQTEYEFKKILSEYSNMLDCRKKQKYYTEEEMRKLVDGEYNVLSLLISVFINDSSNDPESLVYAIFSLASMLAVTIKYFDEIYYFNNKEQIENGEVWHSSHNNWMAIFDQLSSEEFTEQIQDFGFFDLQLNTNENDYYYKTLKSQILSLKQEILDNQLLIEAIDDQEIFNSYNDLTNKEVKDNIEKAFKEAGVSENDKEIFDAVNDAFRKVAIA